MGELHSSKQLCHNSINMNVDNCKLILVRKTKSLQNSFVNICSLITVDMQCVLICCSFELVIMYTMKQDHHKAGSCVRRGSACSTMYPQHTMPHKYRFI